MLYYRQETIHLVHFHYKFYLAQSSSSYIISKVEVASSNSAVAHFPLNLYA